MEIQTDQEALKKAEHDLLLPEGTYTTTPPFTVDLKRDKRGRPYAKFWGEVTMGDVRGKTGFSISWVRKNKSIWVDGQDTGEDSGKPDMLHKNFILASKAFKKAYEFEADSPAKVVEFLRDFQYRLRIIQTQSAENMVVAITPVISS